MNGERPVEPKRLEKRHGGYPFHTFPLGFLAFWSRARAHVCTYVCTRIRLRVYVCTYVCAYVRYAHPCTCTCVRVCMYVRMTFALLVAYLCRHIYLCAYLSTHYVLFNIINVIWHSFLTYWLSVNYVIPIYLEMPIFGTSCRLSCHSSCRYDIRYSLTLFVCDWYLFRDVRTSEQMKLSLLPFLPT